MIRRPLLIVAVLVLAAGIVVNGGWYYARHVAGRAIDDWAAAQRAQGIDVTWRSNEIYGWPLRLDTLFTAPQAVMTTPTRLVTWRGPDSAVRFYLFDAHTIDFGAPGRHTIIVSEGDANAAFTLDAATLDARAETGPGGVFEHLAAGATGLALRGPQEAPLANAKAVQLFWDQPYAAAVDADPTAVSLRLAVRADALEFAPGVLPPTPAPVLGNEIAVFRANVALTGAVDPHLPVPQALEAWRDAGGALDVERLEIVWGPVRMIGDGTLALDAALQPQGAFAARISGLIELLTAMENAAMIDARTAAIARITLAVLTRPSESGGPPEARLPVTIQNGLLSVGPVALLKMPAIVWR